MSAQPSFSLFRLCVATLLAAAITVPVARAQKTTQGPLNALQGFSQNCDEPVRIEADTLEARDKDKVATFRGNVRLVQGDTTLRSKTLVIHYAQDAEPDAASTAPVGTGAGRQQRIRRLEAKGGVTVTRQDQTATGETAVFDLASNTVTLTGNVVITQGPDILRGDRLRVDLTTGVSRVESANAADRRVDALLQRGGTRERSPGNDSERHAASSAPKPQLGSQSLDNSALC